MFITLKRTDQERMGQPLIIKAEAIEVITPKHPKPDTGCVVHTGRLTFQVAETMEQVQRLIAEATQETTPNPYTDDELAKILKDAGEFSMSISNKWPESYGGQPPGLVPEPTKEEWMDTTDADPYFGIRTAACAVVVADDNYNEPMLKTLSNAINDLRLALVALAHKDQGFIGRTTVGEDYRQELQKMKEED